MQYAYQTVCIMKSSSVGGSISIASIASSYSCRLSIEDSSKFLRYKSLH